MISWKCYNPASLSLELPAQPGRTTPGADISGQEGWKDFGCEWVCPLSTGHLRQAVTALESVILCSLWALPESTHSLPCLFPSAVRPLAAQPNQCLWEKKILISKVNHPRSAPLPWKDPLLIVLQPEAYYCLIHHVSVSMCVLFVPVLKYWIAIRAAPSSWASLFYWPLVNWTTVFLCSFTHLHPISSPLMKWRCKSSSWSALNSSSVSLTGHFHPSPLHSCLACFTYFWDHWHSFSFWPACQPFLFFFRCLGTVEIKLIQSTQQTFI